MRITAGSAKGHNLKVPKVSDLRPSQDIVRQAIFNVLAGKFELAKSKVLDLYAGTGALGIEALSRGAEYCDLVDVNPQSCEIIKKNLDHTRFLGKAKVYRMTAERFVREAPPHSYGLIFMDPPYALEPREVIMHLSGLLAENGIIVYLHAKRKVLDEGLSREFSEKYDIVDERKYGATVVTFIRSRVKR